MQNILKFSLVIFLCSSCIDHKDNLTVTPQAIVGGEIVSKNEFSGVVALVRNGDFHCSGVLIANNIILTAAHCVAQETSSSLRVYIGDGINKPSNSEFVRGQYSISKILIHPEIKISTGRGIVNLGEFNANDIAIVFLKEEVKDSEIYQLLTDLFDLKKYLDVDQVTTIVGFGHTKEEIFGTKNKLEYGLKRKVEIPINDYNNHEVDIRQQGKDSCYIDSGGPVFIDVYGKKKILALVSGSNGKCGENEFPVYYSLAFDSICWISKETGLGFDDVLRNCERNDLIKEKCSLGTKEEQNKCAKNLSFLIFKTQILD